MKKVIVLILVVICSLLLFGCNQTNTSQNDESIKQTLLSTSDTYQIDLKDEEYNENKFEEIKKHYKTLLKTNVLEIKQLSDDEISVNFKDTIKNIKLIKNYYYSISYDKNFLELLNGSQDYYLKETLISFKILKPISKIFLNDKEFLFSGQGFEFSLKNKTIIKQESSELNPSFLKSISTNDALSLISENTSNDNFVILDVRTPLERKNGFIAGSINIDYYDSFDSNTNDLDKDKTYLIYCRTQNRSKEAAKILENKGFKYLYYMLGGFSTWQFEGKPIEK